MALDSFAFHWSATSLARGSSGLGALRSAWIDSRTVLICRAGLHLSAGRGKGGREEGGRREGEGGGRRERGKGERVGRKKREETMENEKEGTQTVVPPQPG